LKLNGTHQLLVYADGSNILGGNVQTVKKNTDALVVASKVIGLDVNSERNMWSYLEVRTQHKVTIYEVRA
jgi:hypothetical protein